MKAVLVEIKGSSEIYTIYSNGKAFGSLLKDDADRTMFRYGKSKVIHWNNRCAAPNANSEPSKVSLLDGMKQG